MNISDFYYIHTKASVCFCCNVCFAISRDARSLDSNNNEGYVDVPIEDDREAMEDNQVLDDEDIVDVSD